MNESNQGPVRLKFRRLHTRIGESPAAQHGRYMLMPSLGVLDSRVQHAIFRNFFYVIILDVEMLVVRKSDQRQPFRYVPRLPTQVGIERFR